MMEMIVRMKRVLWLTLLMTVGAAQSARASIFDIIWEMSGPQLVGFGAQCEFDRHSSSCFWRARSDFAAEDFIKRKIWLNVEPSLYLATGAGKWEVGSVLMFAFDPMVAIKVNDGDRYRLYTAAGASFNYFAGASVDDFGRVALKLRPLTFDYLPKRSRLKAVSFSYTWRYYDGIAVTSDPIGRPVLGKGGPAEWVQGPTVAFLF